MVLTQLMFNKCVFHLQKNEKREIVRASKNWEKNVKKLNASIIIFFLSPILRYKLLFMHQPCLCKAFFFSIVSIARAKCLSNPVYGYNKLYTARMICINATSLTLNNILGTKYINRLSFISYWVICTTSEMSNHMHVCRMRIQSLYACCVYV